MKRISILLISLLVGIISLFSQTTVSRVDQILDAPMPQIGQYMDSVLSPNTKKWLSETSLDSINQEDLPKIVTSGLLFNANMSNFFITGKKGTSLQTTSSYLRVGMELGGFMDFLVTRHFAIQARLVFTAEQNQFGVKDSTNHLWSFGADIPVLFLFRLGNLQKGYLNVGAGVFAHFTFASNVGIYKNIETSVAPSEAPPSYVSLHDNHAGIIAHIGYEFPIGIQINFNYLISLSDIFGYYKNTQGTPENNVAFYPQRLSLGIAYRWKK